jgi:carbon storage regulator
MLVLGRKENQSIIIGDNIRVTIVGRSGSSIRIGVQAPREIPVLREEVRTESGSAKSASALRAE